MKIRHILLRDLKVLLSDKKNLAFILVMPIILTSILSFALAGVFGDDPSVPEFKVAIVKGYESQPASQAIDEALGNNLLGDFLPADVKKDIMANAEDLDMEKIFFEDFLGHEDIKDMMHHEIMTEEEALRKLENDELSAVILLPENFLRASYANMLTTYQSKIDIEIIKNPERSVTSSIAASIVEGFMQRMSASNIRKNIAVETFLSADINTSEMNDRGHINKLVNQSYSQDLNLTFYDETATGGQGISSKSYYSVSMLTLFLLFSAGRGSYMLLEEKRDFTYQRMLSAGITRWRILSGKFLVIFVLSLVQLSILITYSRVVLGVTWGNVSSLIIVSLFTAFAVSGLGTLLAVITFISDKTRIASLFESVIFQIMGLLGGAYIPIEVLPSEIQSLSQVPLNGVALKAFLAIMTGSNIRNISHLLVILTLNGLVFAGVGIALMRKKGETKHVGSDQAQVTGA